MKSMVFRNFVMFVMGLMSFVWIGRDASAAIASELKIGVVDMQSALETVEEGKNAKSRLEKIVQKKNEEFKKEQEELKKVQEELQKQSLVLSDKAKNEKQADFQQRAMELQQKGAQTQMELAKMEKDLTDPIIRKLRNIIAGIANEKGYNLVLEKNENSVLYSMEKDDLTEAVVSKYNKSK